MEAVWAEAVWAAGAVSHPARRAEVSAVEVFPAAVAAAAAGSIAAAAPTRSRVRFPVAPPASPPSRG